jgi:hypothetical protein
MNTSNKINFSKLSFLLGLIAWLILALSLSVFYFVNYSSNENIQTNIYAFGVTILILGLLIGIVGFFLGILALSIKNKGKILLASFSLNGPIVLLVLFLIWLTLYGGV